MERIEFSELTNRLRRNLMASSFLIVSIKEFDITINGVNSYGMKLENLTTEVITVILFLILIYHAIAFFTRAFEEYRFWELKLSNITETYMSGGEKTLGLNEQISSLAETLDKITKNSGILNKDGQEIFNNADAQELARVRESADRYASRFSNFPMITRLRFWIWDIGTAFLIACIAALYMFSFLQPGSLMNIFTVLSSLRNFQHIDFA